MKNILFITLLIGQLTDDKSHFFLFDQINVKEISKIEAEFNSKKRDTRRATVSDDFFPGATKYYLEYPISFERKGKEFNPFPVVEYYYTAEDSLVRLIVYNWDKTEIFDNLFDLQKELKNEARRLNEYNRKYDELLKQLNEKLGKSISGDGKINEIKQGQKSFIERNIKWTRGKCNVELNMIFSTDNSTMGTYRIRTKIYWD